MILASSAIAAGANAVHASRARIPARWATLLISNLPGDRQAPVMEQIIVGGRTSTPPDSMQSPRREVLDRVQRRSGRSQPWSWGRAGWAIVLFQSSGSGDQG